MQHGWLSNKLFFNNLQKDIVSILPESEFVSFNANYYNEGDFDYKLNNFNGYKVIAVGHSLGFYKLLRSNINFDAIVSICGFVNFSRAKVKFVMKNFSSNLIVATKFLNIFYKKYNLPTLNYKNANRQRLMQDLEMIYDMNKYTATLIDKLNYCKSLALCNRYDFIVNNKISQFTNSKCFVNTLDIHLLGLCNSKLCAKKIVDFLKSIDL